MQITRGMSLGLLAIAAIPWAGTMVLGGVWLIAEAPERWRLPAGACALGGVFWVAAGQLLVMCLVADRFCPRVPRALSWTLEILACVVLFVSMLWLAVDWGLAVWGGRA